MESNNTETPATASQEAKSWMQRSKVWLILIVALVLSNVGTFFYQNYQQGKLKDAHQEALKAQADKADLLMTYRIGKNATELGLAIQNTVQAEMVRGNKEILDQYMIGMVQNTEVELVSVVDSVGMVYLSTNKKFEGKHILDVLPRVPSRVETPQVFDTNAGETLYASPIMAKDHRIGTLVLTYKTDMKTETMLQEIKDQAAVKEE